MLIVYIYVGILLCSETEPYWNTNSNQIVEFFPWFDLKSECALNERTIYVVNSLARPLKCIVCEIPLTRSRNFLYLPDCGDICCFVCCA